MAVKVPIGLHNVKTPLGDLHAGRRLSSVT